MEPPAKRPRLGRAAGDRLPLDDGRGDGDNDEDEIAMDPEEFAMKQDPQYRLQVSRAAADSKLKTTFERLFEKYGRDFGDTGDEINFYTDEIEIDNGHIASLPVADETSVEAAVRYQDTLAESEKVRLLHRRSHSNSSASGRDAAHRSGQGTPSAAMVRRRGLSSASGTVTAARLSSLLVPHFRLQSPMGGNSFGMSSGSLSGISSQTLMPLVSTGEPSDPAWAVPDLPGMSRPGFSTPQRDGLMMQQFQIARDYSAPADPLIVRKALPIGFRGPARSPSFGYGHNSQDGYASDNDDDEDDVLALDPPDTVTRTKSRVMHSIHTSSITPMSNPPTQQRHDRDTQGTPNRVRADSARKVRRPREGSRIVNLAEGATKEVREQRTVNQGSLSSKLLSSSVHKPPAPVAALAVDSTGKVVSKEGQGPPLITIDTSHSISTTAYKASTKREAFVRNTVDPSYAFSDEEDSGLRKRPETPVESYDRTRFILVSSMAKPAPEAAPSVLPTVPASTAFVQGVPIKRGPGRPRKKRPDEQAPAINLPVQATHQLGFTSNVRPVPSMVPGPTAFAHDVPKKRGPGRPRKQRPDETASTQGPPALAANGQPNPPMAPGPTAFAHDVPKKRGPGRPRKRRPDELVPAIDLPTQTTHQIAFATNVRSAMSEPTEIAQAVPKKRGPGRPRKKRPDELDTTKILPAQTARQMAFVLKAGAPQASGVAYKSPAKDQTQSPVMLATPRPRVKRPPGRPPGVRTSVKPADSLTDSVNDATNDATNDEACAFERRKIPDSQGHSSIISLVSDGDDSDPDDTRVDTIRIDQPWQDKSDGPSKRVLNGRRLPFSAGPIVGPYAQQRVLGDRTVHATVSSYLASIYASPLTSRLKKQLPSSHAATTVVASARGSTVQTLDEALRQCGQDGVRCGRQFCFACS